MKNIIEKWYLKLGFDDKYNDEFYKALSTINIAENTSIDTYDLESTDGKKNLLSFLYMCEALEQKYIQKGIDNAILSDTLADIVRWTNTWSAIKGELYLGELFWLRHHMKMNLFKLGRLQYCMDKVWYDAPEKNLFEGDTVLSIHIPATGPLDYEECIQSLKTAKEFFRKFYPEFNYKYFICSSWLLDETLSEIMKPDSNILKFQTLFDIDSAVESEAIVKFVFGWNITRDMLGDIDAPNSFCEKIKNRFASGGKFYAGRGIIRSDILK